MPAFHICHSPTCKRSGVHPCHEPCLRNEPRPKVRATESLPAEIWRRQRRWSRFAGLSCSSKGVERAPKRATAKRLKGGGA
jgi:hypothetical protein